MKVPPGSPPKSDNGDETRATNENTHQNVREKSDRASPSRHVALTTDVDEKRSSSGRMIRLPERYRDGYDLNAQ